jgi:hypothetical protein
MSEPTIDIRYVDTRKTSGVVDALVTADNGTLHRIGHLPTTDWFCTCPKARRCPHITQIAELVPRIPLTPTQPQTGS